MLRVTSDERKYAICAAAHIAYLGAILRKRKAPGGGDAPGGSKPERGPNDDQEPDEALA